LKQQMQTERVQTLVIGGGQAGLSTGYHLRSRRLPFLILDASPRIGDAWRNRWDSLRLFTPARFDGLDGMPFPAPPNSFPTKDEMADYLADYAQRFDLPVRTGVRVDGLSRQGKRYVVTAGQRRFEAEQVVVAMARYQTGRVPRWDWELNPNIVQLHSSAYRSPKQLQEGGVLLVGAVTRARKLPLKSHALTAPGCPAAIPGTSRFGSTGLQHDCSWRVSCSVLCFIVC
jgi:putative flavoprotein involved in K+ transport